MNKEIESLEQSTRRAYVLGYKLLDTEHDEETIYAKIEKQNIPEKIARQVAADIILERQKRDYIEERPSIVILIIVASISIIGAILSVIYTDHLVLSFGCILSATLYTIRYYNKRPKDS